MKDNKQTSLPETLSKDKEKEGVNQGQKELITGLKQAFNSPKVENKDSLITEEKQTNNRRGTGGDLSFLELLKESEIDLSEELAAPPVCLEVVKNGKTYTFGTLGNFSLLTGKAKSRKSFFVGVMVAAALKNDLTINQLKGKFREDKRTVLYFDTEQSSYHVQKAAKRVLGLAEFDVIPNFRVFALRKHSATERLGIIQAALDTIPNIGLVVIDGVRDLVGSINSEEDAIDLAAALMRWSENLHCHIVGVLHQNKGDNNARGHLGTEFVNKAETTVSISTKDEITTIKATQCRDLAFPDIYFEIGEDGLPKEADAPKKDQQGKKRKVISPFDYEEREHIEVLQYVKNQNPKSYHDLVDSITNAWARYDVKFGTSVGKRFATEYRSRKYFENLGKGKGYKFNIPPYTGG